jgi:DNA-binding GntR family transcriptional regulator
VVTRAVPVPQSELDELVTIDRTSPIPLYYQVAQALQHAIEEGRLPPGSRLDNELQLADDLGLSRPTMRRAMEYLVEQGLLIRRRGIGTTVVQPKVRRPVQLSSLFDDLQTAGKRPSTAVISFDVAPPSAEVAEALRLADGTGVHRIVRLRSADARPIALMTNYVPTDLPGLGPEHLNPEALENAGLYRLFRAANIHLHAADQVVGARKATQGEAQLLDEPRGAALLTMQRITFDDSGRPVEFGTHVYAASRYSLSLSLLDS